MTCLCPKGPNQLIPALSAVCGRLRAQSVYSSLTKWPESKGIVSPLSLIARGCNKKCRVRYAKSKVIRSCEEGSRGRCRNRDATKSWLVRKGHGEGKCMEVVVVVGVVISSSRLPVSTEYEGGKY